MSIIQTVENEIKSVIEKVENFLSGAEADGVEDSQEVESTVTENVAALEADLKATEAKVGVEATSVITEATKAV